MPDKLELGGVTSGLSDIGGPFWSQCHDCHHSITVIKAMTISQVSEIGAMTQVVPYSWNVTTG